MQLNTYQDYLDKTQKDFPEIIAKYQQQLNESTTKAEDLYILNSFWNEFSDKAMEKWENNYELWTDENSKQPMPESVAKQFTNMLFDINNINLLFDLDINEGLNDAEYYEELNGESVYTYPKDIVLKKYSERFALQK